jgi:hypothetical protein
MEQRPSAEANYSSAGKNHSVFPGSRTFITAFTTARHSLLRKPDESSPHPHTIFKIHFNIISTYTSGPRNGGFHLGSSLFQIPTM